MKPGEIVEYSIWLSGKETEEQLQHYRSVVVNDVLRMTAVENSVLLGEPRFTTKQPGEDRVPPVPTHVSGPCVRLLVVEAEVVALAPKVVRNSFLSELDEKDLNSLRRATRRAHARAHPGMPLLNNEQCDAIIEAIGPETAAMSLRRGESLH